MTARRVLALVLASLAACSVAGSEEPRAPTPLGVSIVMRDPPGPDCELVGNFYSFAGPCNDFAIQRESEPAGCIEREVANHGGNVGVVDGSDGRGLWTGRVYRCPSSGPAR